MYCLYSNKMEQQTKTLVCPGCGATLKHPSSLSTHKNGNVKKGLKPCKKYFAQIGKTYEEKIETKTLTEEDVKAFHSIFKPVMEWMKLEEEKITIKLPPILLKPFGKHYPPSHIKCKEWIKSRFMKSRFEQFVASMWAAWHVDTVNGREYCNVRIPRASHSAEAEIFDGTCWRWTQLYNVLYDFIQNGLHPVLEDIREEEEEYGKEDHRFAEKLYRFINRWSPDEPEDLKKREKVDIDDDNVKKIILYDDLINLAKAPLLGEKRAELNLIKKQHAHTLNI